MVLKPSQTAQLAAFQTRSYTRLLDVVSGRSDPALAGWLAGQPDSGGGYSRRPLGTVAARATRSTASTGCCAVPPTICPRTGLYMRRSYEATMADMKLQRKETLSW